MQLIITEKQQHELLKAQALNRLSRTELSQELKLSVVTLRKVLDTPAPLVVNSKTYQAITDYLVDQLANK